MGMSSHVSFSSKDTEKRKKLAQQTIDNLNKLEMEIPNELYDHLEDYTGLTDATTEINEEGCNGYTIDITKLPKHITLIHFKNCY